MKRECDRDARAQGRVLNVHKIRSTLTISGERDATEMALTECKKGPKKHANETTDKCDNSTSRLGRGVARRNGTFFCQQGAKASLYGSGASPLNHLHPSVARSWNQCVLQSTPEPVAITKISGMFLSLARYHNPLANSERLS